jgi:hypothetical protein
MFERLTQLAANRSHRSMTHLRLEGLPVTSAHARQLHTYEDEGLNEMDGRIASDFYHD